MKLRNLLEEYDYLDNVSLTVYVPLEKGSITALEQNNQLPDPKKITKDLYQDYPPPGINPININVLRAIFLEDDDAAQFAFDNQHLGLLSPEGFVRPWSSDTTPLTGLSRYQLDGLLIATIVVDLRDLMTQDIQYDIGAEGILDKLKNSGIDRKTFSVAREWLLENYESTPQAQIGLGDGEVNVDQWPAPRLSQQEIEKAQKTEPPEFDLDWN